MARPRKIVDGKKLMELAANCCTNEEIAQVLGISDDTLTRRFADLLERGRAEARASLRSLQFRAARKGNSVLLVWLGKQLLGQKDKTEHSGKIEHELALSDKDREDARKIVSKLMEG